MKRVDLWLFCDLEAEEIVETIVLEGSSLNAVARQVSSGEALLGKLVRAVRHGLMDSG